MKACVILINWAFSFMGLCIDTEYSPMWAVLIGFTWFALSCLLVIHADGRGWLDKFKNH